MRRLLLLACLACVSACSQLYYDLGSPLLEDQLPAEGEQPGLADVLSQLGPPQRISAVPGGYVVAWEHWQIREQALGVSLGPLGVDLFSVDWGNARIAGEFLLMNFDRQHRYTGGSFTRWDEQSGSGTALQPSLGIVEIVDVSDLLRPMPQHRWGAMSLQTLPRTLNRSSSPEAGDAGLEQRGTPLGAGQRSLELDR